MGEIRKIATVIGMNSFVEDYLIERLAKENYSIRFAVPQPSKIKRQKIFGKVGQITPLFLSPSKERTIVRAIEGAELVINLFEANRSDTYNLMHEKNVNFVKQLAKLCSASGVRKVFHFSVLGASENSKSTYLSSKFEGEQNVIKEFENAFILRPSIIFGPGDSFLNKLCQIISYLPVVPVYNVNTRLQPVYAGDIADAVCQLSKKSKLNTQILNLAGSETYTNRELVTLLIHWLHRSNNISGLTPTFIRLMSYFLQYMPGKLISPELLNMMEYDSCLDNLKNDLIQLGIVPKSLNLIIPTYLTCYRPDNDLKNMKKLLH